MNYYVLLVVCKIPHRAIHAQDMHTYLSSGAGVIEGVLGGSECGVAEMQMVIVYSIDGIAQGTSLQRGGGCRRVGQC